MKVAQHFVISLCVSGLVWAWFSSFAAALCCMIGGVLIDVDHVIDYYWQYKRLPLRNVSHAFYFEAFDNIFVIFHSWELVLLYVAILWLVGWQPILAGFAIGAFTHLLLDNIFNKHSALAYFFTCRLLHGFSGKYFYEPSDYHKRLKHVKKQTQR